MQQTGLPFYRLGSKDLQQSGNLPGIPNKKKKKDQHSSMQAWWAPAKPENAMFQVNCNYLKSHAGMLTIF